MYAKTKYQGCRETASLLSADGNVEDKFSLKRLLKQSYLRTPKTKIKTKQKKKQNERKNKKSTNKRVKNMNWNFTHSKNCCDEKDAIKKDRKQLLEWYKPLANQIYKRLAPRVHKEIL